MNRMETDGFGVEIMVTWYLNFWVSESAFRVPPKFRKSNIIKNMELAAFLHLCSLSSKWHSNSSGLFVLNKQGSFPRALKTYPSASH